MNIDDPVDGKGDILLAYAHCYDIVGVVREAGGYSTLFESIALDISYTDMPCISVAFNDTNLQNIFFGVDVICIALVCGDDFTGDHTYDAARPFVHKIFCTEFSADMESVHGAFLQEGVDLRLREREHFSVSVAQYTAFIYAVNFEALKIVDDDEVRQIAGRDRSLIIQKEIAGRIVAGCLDCDDRIDSGSYCSADVEVHVTDFQQIIRMFIVCREHTS